MGWVSKLEDETDRRIDAGTIQKSSSVTLSVRDMPNNGRLTLKRNTDSAFQAFCDALDKCNAHHQRPMPKKVGRAVSYAIESDRLCREMKIALARLTASLPKGADKRACESALRQMRGHIV